MMNEPRMNARWTQARSRFSVSYGTTTDCVHRWFIEWWMHLQWTRDKRSRFFRSLQYHNRYTFIHQWVMVHHEWTRDERNRVHDLPIRSGTITQLRATMNESWIPYATTTEMHLGEWCMNFQWLIKFSKSYARPRTIRQNYETPRPRQIWRARRSLPRHMLTRETSRLRTAWGQSKG